MPFTTRIKWELELANLKEMTNKGMTFVEIGEHYGVTKQRIKQVFQRFNLTHVGLKFKARQHAEAYTKKWGVRQDTDLYVVQRDKYRAKKARTVSEGKEFTIAFGEIHWPMYCPMLGLKIDYFADGRQEDSPSFDRIDPNKGYVAGNVVICSWRANRIKNDGSASEHRAIAEWLEKQHAST